MKEEEDDTLIEDLQDLLRPLTSQPLSLAILSSHAANSNSKNRKEKRARTSTSSTTEEEAAHHLKRVRKEELDLFESCIGPYEDVLAGACRHVKLQSSDQQFADRKDSELFQRYSDPDRHYVEGPQPDVHV